ncbi:MAG TPA: hypothetical protein VFL51_05410 [Pseudolabrys sp.]|nr:hypothetical protein [Pseudolabrys sp.]
MRYTITAICALAVGGLYAAVPAQAQEQDTMSQGMMNQSMVHSAGGPTQMGGNCWVSTNADMGYGYWTACENPAPAVRRAKKR